MSLGTAFNVYHVTFDLVAPIFYAQMNEYGRTRPNNTVVVLSVGNAAKSKGGTDTIIRLSQWYDLPCLLCYQKFLKLSCLGQLLTALFLKLSRNQYAWMTFGLGTK